MVFGIGDVRPTRWPESQRRRPEGRIGIHCAWRRSEFPRLTAVPWYFDEERHFSDVPNEAGQTRRGCRKMQIRLSVILGLDLRRLSCVRSVLRWSVRKTLRPR